MKYFLCFFLLRWELIQTSLLKGHRRVWLPLLGRGLPAPVQECKKGIYLVTPAWAPPPPLLGFIFFSFSSSSVFLHPPVFQLLARASNAATEWWPCHTFLAVLHSILVQEMLALQIKDLYIIKNTPRPNLKGQCTNFCFWSLIPKSFNHMYGIVFLTPA